MNFRIASALLTAALFAGCPLSPDKPDKKKAKAGAEAKTKDESSDVAFQAFIGRLRTAVERRDMNTLAMMMTADFGYRWDTPPQGDNVFGYWDQQNLWPVLASLIRQKWVPYNGFMVVPSALATNPDYDGYRAGVRMVNGSWRFAYFVPAPPPDPGLPPAQDPVAPSSL